MSAEVLLLTLSLVGAPMAQALVPTSSGTSGAPSERLVMVPAEGGGPPAPVAREANGATDVRPGDAAGDLNGVAEASSDAPGSKVPASAGERPMDAVREDGAPVDAPPEGVVHAVADGDRIAPAPLVPEQERVEAEHVGLIPHASVVPSRAFPVRMAGVGITLVGLASYIGGQLVMDAADRMPAGPDRREKFDFGLSIRGGGLGAVITGVSIWLIAGELTRWEDAPPARVGFVPVRDGGAVTFSMGLP